jgi:RND family efflux transporter MFP subunit
MEANITIMNNFLKNMKYLTLLLAVVLAACQSALDDNHAHNPDGSHAAVGDDLPRVEYTVWTEKTELFVEFPVLIVGRTSRFAAHFTVLEQHQPVREGSLTVSLIHGKKGIRATTAAPASEGIFKPALQPLKAGIYQLIFELNTPNLADSIVIQNVHVFETEEEAIAASQEEVLDGAITFLKEQAWKMEFQTQPVTKKMMYNIIPTSGVWRTSTSDFSAVVATSSGSVAFTSENLTAGSGVKKGQLLLTLKTNGLAENNLGTEIAKAEAIYEQAEADYRRKKKLFESEVVAKSDLEEVFQKYLVAKANYESLREGYSVEGKQIYAPFSGFIASISVENGQFVNQGAELFAITKNRSSVLESYVSSAYASQIEILKDVWYQPIDGVWASLMQTGGKILSVGRSVASDKPMLSVFVQTNEPVFMPEGSFGEVQLAFGTAKEALVIPATALLEDYGNYAVIVQLTGESFERRPITIGARNGDSVEVLSGLKFGEVVVSTGAYQVKMASMSGQVPAHGHAH